MAMAAPPPSRARHFRLYESENRPSGQMALLHLPPSPGRQDVPRRSVQPAPLSVILAAPLCARSRDDGASCMSEQREEAYLRAAVDRVTAILSEYDRSSQQTILELLTVGHAASMGRPGAAESIQCTGAVGVC